jgi:hypothetical protein
MQRSFDAGFQPCTKLNTPTSSFGLRPRTHEIALGDAPLSDLADRHGSHPWLLVQRDKSLAHEGTVSRPGGGLIAEPFHPGGQLLPQFARGSAIPKQAVPQHDCIKAARTRAPTHPQSERLQVLGGLVRQNLHRHLIVMLESNAMWILEIGDPGVGVLRAEHLHHRPSCLGAGVLWQQDSAATTVGGKADSGAEFTVKDHRIVLACNDVLVGRAPATTCTPHGLPYDVLLESIVVAICPQLEPAFHPAFDVPGSDHARSLTQDTRGEDQGAFRVPLPLADAPKFPHHC